MTYKLGGTPEKNDEVMGLIDGKPARGRVLAVRENGNVLVTRRAPYKGPDKPLAAEHVEVPASELTLIYRPMNRAAAPAARPTVAAAKGPKPEAKKKSAGSKSKAATKA